MPYISQEQVEKKYYQFRRKEFPTYNEAGIQICCDCGKKILPVSGQYICDFCMGERSRMSTEQPDSGEVAALFDLFIILERDYKEHFVSENYRDNAIKRAFDILKKEGKI